MATSNFNMEDPAKQEAIRRGPHKYIPTAGKHGSYVPEPYKHQEYPKMVCKDPEARIQGLPEGQRGLHSGRCCAAKLPDSQSRSGIGR